MILYTNGCSWTYGGGLNLDKPEQKQERLNSVWPYHLGKLLNCEKVVNLAQGCGSNQRIFRTTLNWLMETPQEILSTTTAVIQWTEPSRFEIYMPENKNDIFEDRDERWIAIKINAALSNFHFDTEDIIDDTNKMFQFHTEIEGFYKSLCYFESLHSLFQSFGVKYYYWSHQTDFEVLPSEKNNLLKKYNWLGEPNNKWVYDRVSHTDAHPSFTGHKQLAEIIHSYIRQLRS